MHYAVKTGSILLKYRSNFLSIAALYGAFIIEKPLPPPEPFEVLSKAVQRPKHGFSNCDGRPLYTPHDYGLEEHDEYFPGPIRPYSVADHLSFDQFAVAGQKFLIIIPTGYSPLQDMGPVMSHKTFPRILSKL